MAHTLDTYQRIPATANTTTNANPVTATYTCGTGATVLVVGIVSVGTVARGGGAPTYNGETLTQAGTRQIATASPEEASECWYLLAPSIGSYTVSIPNTGAHQLDIVIASFSAASGASALDVATGGNATSTNPSVSVTTTADGDAIFAVVGDGANTWNPTARTGTQLYDNDNGNWGAGTQYILQSTAGAQAMGWTFGTSEDWAICIASFKEAGAATLPVSSSWKILAEQSISSAWRTLAESSRQTAWAIYAQSSLNAAWGILAAQSLETSWGIENKSDASLDVSWSILDENSAPISWGVINTIHADTSWNVLKDRSIETSWGIENAGIMSVPIAWGITAEASKSTAWKVINGKSLPSSWGILTQQAISISWQVQNTRTVSIDLAWRNLTGASIQNEWRVLTARELLTQWHINASETSFSTSWSVLAANHKRTAWNVMTEDPLTVSWHNMAAISENIEWYVEGGTPQPVVSGIDFLSLVTPSISFDTAIAAAASGAGAELTANRDLIPLELIYSRINELPEDVLDHVAWGCHVDGYELATTVKQKRYLIKNFYDFHRYKGTLHGHRLHWRALLGLEILKADPPSKSYVGVTMTAAERAAFEAKHPEVRVYPFRHSGIKGSLFCGDCLGGVIDSQSPIVDTYTVDGDGYAVVDAEGEFSGGGYSAETMVKVFPFRTDALLRIGDKVTLYDPLLGEEADLNSFQYSPEYVTQKQADTIEIHKRGTVFGAIFAGEFLHGSAVDTGASDRLYTLRLVSESSTEIERRTPLSIQPSLEPFRTTYDVTLEPGAAGSGFFLRNRYLDSYPDKAGSFIGQHFPFNTDAEQRVYKRLKLFDPSRVTFQGARKMTFLGGFRIGAQLPHTARIAIDMISRKIPGAQYVAGYLRGRCLCRTDAETRIEQMRYVGILAKRLSDKISMQIHNRFQVKASSGLAVGSKQCGQYQLEVI